MRGKGAGNLSDFDCFGITPAYAGKSCEWAEFATTEEDHPRLCGEKIEERNPSDYVLGSPPPMRGKGRLHLVRRKLFRITPAYAGKSFPTVPFVVFLGDHPRLCGEKLLITSNAPFRAGSPPPMRGKVSISVPIPFSERITPAYAGKSSACDKHCHCDGDHPRLCGEKEPLALIPVQSQGSPPPMRGKGKVHGKSIRPWRITPAYAGKSSSL